MNSTEIIAALSAVPWYGYFGAFAVGVFFKNLYKSRQEWVRMQNEKLEGTPRKVCVIGAGISGLTAIKHMREAGHDVVCYEKEKVLGGVWQLDTAVSASKVYDTCTATSSNHATSFSDFPVDKRCSGYGKTHMNAKDFYDYLYQYGKRFDLLKHIRYERTVVNMAQKDNGNWLLTSKDAQGKEETEEFGGVAICSGLNQNPHIPEMKGADKFKGRIVHSKDFKSAHEFKGKDVVILGCGESGADLVKDVGDAGNNVFLSLRRGVWILPRIVKDHPNDYFTTRAMYTLPLILRLILGKWFFYSIHLYGLIPTLTNTIPEEGKVMRRLAKLSKGDMFNQFATKSDRFLSSFVEKKVELKPMIEEITETTVKFTDGTEVHADAIILCTGYKFSFPFFRNAPKDAREMFKVMIPQDVPNVAVIGALRPGLGAIPPCAEIQARWFAMLLNGTRKLPPPEKMKQVINMEGTNHKKLLFTVTDRMHYLVDYTFYLNTIAGFVGCKPNLWKLIQHPKLWWKVVFGPFTAHQFRIHGPDSDDIAKKIILDGPIVTSWKTPLFWTGAMISTVLSEIPGLGMFAPRITLS